MLLVVIASVWKQISYNFLFFLAGLQSIPKSLIEAAAIDGAGPMRRFWTIVFPLLSPTTFFLLVVNIVYAFFDTFGVIDATTQGGPAGATQILVYKVYHDGVKSGRPRRLVGAVGDPDDHRDRADGRAVPLHRAQGALLMAARMVENRPWLTFALARGADRSASLVVAFPVYVTFVASTLTLDQIISVPMPLLPGDQFLAQLLAGADRRVHQGLRRGGVDDADEQPDHGAGDRRSARSRSRSSRRSRSSTSASRCATSSSG